MPESSADERNQKVRIRNTCRFDSQLHVMIRRGDRIVFESEMLKFKPIGKDWNTWGRHDVTLPESAKPEPGVYHIEVVEPPGGGGKGADIDVAGIVRVDDVSQEMGRPRFWTGAAA